MADLTLHLCARQTPFKFLHHLCIAEI